MIENSDCSVKKILIGNKFDIQEVKSLFSWVMLWANLIHLKERKVKTLEGAELAQKYKMAYFETR